MYTHTQQNIFHLIPPLSTERKVDLRRMTFLLRVTSLLLWPITIRFIVHITPLSIISPPFHHPLLLSPCTPDRLMFSYKMEETCITFIDVGFEPLQIKKSYEEYCTNKMPASPSLMSDNCTGNTAAELCHACKFARCIPLTSS